jgi:branched-chain amino acid transport system ATP-binding protein
MYYVEKRFDELILAEARVLEVHGLQAWYGRTQALFDVSFEVGPGEAVALVGPNGAGKSTTVRSICGIVRTRGSIAIAGRTVQEMPPHVRVRELGLGVVHEGRGLFSELTVKENILAGINRTRADRLPETLQVFPRIRDRLSSPVTLLSGGEQQMVALARVFLQQPRVLLLDEPALGLAPVMVDEIYEVLLALRDRGVTTVLVEPSVPRARSFANRLVLLKRGVSNRSVQVEDEEGVERLMHLVEIE